YKKLLAIQKTSLTVALEAGRACFRKKLNKNIEIENLFNSADALSRLGLRMIKVYFMYGFPDEEKEDLLAIGNLIKELLDKTNFKINVSLNLFIPKPFSPWENKPLLGPAKAEEKKDTILANIPKRKRIKLSYSSINTSLIEAIISRGGRDLGSVFIELNRQRKELLDKNLLFNWPVWKDVLEKKDINWQRYIKAETKNFPWSFIDNRG
ncbi:MAG: hypothetical protein K9L69_02220, partial [Candidatus Omnitrophica bacterium]|nr:hypothetical protein [Candidatus Omnitrophota bacterium]